MWRKPTKLTLSTRTLETPTLGPDTGKTQPRKKVAKNTAQLSPELEETTLIVSYNDSDEENSDDETLDKTPEKNSTTPTNG